MKALVLSGGAGTRLRPFSYSMPKQLIPVANKPVLEHVLANIRELGVDQIGIIVGDRGRQIRDALGDGGRFGCRITYLPQEHPLGLAHCVGIARDFLGDDDFVMYLGDNMLPQGIGAIAEEFRRGRSAAHVLVRKVADPSAFGVAELHPDGRVRRLVEKPAEPVSDLAMIGVYFFTPAVHEAVAAIRPSARGELEITDAIQWLVERGDTVRATEYDGYWKDTGNVDDLLDCNRELLAGLRRSIGGTVEDSVVTGAVVLEPGARLVRSQVAGPAIIAAGTVVADSYVGPGTSIGRDCVLRDTHIDYSIALDGSRICDVKGLHGSVIGRAATVDTADGRPDGAARHRLVIGDHTRIEVAA
jgi:glucose-1-phosphate thymidylyltransferase